MDLTGKRRVTPSRPNYWDGTVVEGQDITREQYLARMAKRTLIESNLRRYSLPERVSVPINIEPTHDKPLGGRRMVICPVISGTKDRSRLQVIAPNGMETWVQWPK